MALSPRFAGQLLDLSSPPTSQATPPTIPHTLELYLDYVCPFSAKIFNTFYNDVVPLIQKRYTAPNGVRVILRQQIQPWHPSSTLVHEAGAAVLRLAPGKFWAFSAALFIDQKTYFDENVVNEGRNETYKRLAKLAAGSAGVDEKEVFDLLVIGDKPGKDGSLNAGNKVTDDVKFMVKTNRLTGVHVTPTVLFNGAAAVDISSGWNVKQWEEWLEKNVK